MAFGKTNGLVDNPGIHLCIHTRLPHLQNLVLCNSGGRNTSYSINDAETIVYPY